ncbi:MAG: formate-dependent phosphoribosylglycinamide formyltransferase [Pseudomonadota bacterium]
MVDHRDIATRSAAIGPPGSPAALRLVLLGSGELGKEVAIEAQRLGLEVIAVDRYPNAPAMQVAHRSHVIDMLDGTAIKSVINQEMPALIVPEIEAIATDALLDLERDGFVVTPNARAARLTMDREGIRRLAADELGLPTSRFAFAGNEEEYLKAVDAIGLPCVIKPVMSSSGKGQSLLRKRDDALKAWRHAQSGGRAGHGRVIVESFIDFDYEITMLTVRHRAGITLCPPVGHTQIDGDYRESWQPHSMSETALARAGETARAIVEELEGYGLFGVELFVKDDQVWFSEVSPRPHDTGMVTLISQDLSEFALHLRAMLGLPIPAIRQLGPAASCAVVQRGESNEPVITGLTAALTEPDTQIRLFGKPEVHGQRRLGVALARGEDIDAARRRARRAAASLHLQS